MTSFHCNDWRWYAYVLPYQCYHSPTDYVNTHKIVFVKSVHTFVSPAANMALLYLLLSNTFPKITFCRMDAEKTHGCWDTYASRPFTSMLPAVKDSSFNIAINNDVWKCKFNSQSTTEVKTQNISWPLITGKSPVGSSRPPWVSHGCIFTA